MQRMIAIILVLLYTQAAGAQTAKSIAIGKSGCSALFYCTPAAFTADDGPDSSQVYTGSCAADGATYGVICTRNKDKVSSMQASEDMLAAYLNYLKQSYEIASSTGYKRGLRLKNSEATRGITEQWKGGDGNDWRVIGWTNGRYIGVLYVMGSKLPAEAKVNSFLNGFVFGK